MTIKKRIQYFLYYLLPPRIYAKLCYRHFTKKISDFKNPSTFTEKRWWLKYYYKKYQPNLIKLCYDKYTVREYIKRKIGEEYLIPLLGVWDNADEIDFEKLPNKFILKISQSNGYNIICRDKKNLDIEKVKKRLSCWLSDVKRAKVAPEIKYYLTSSPKIICEELLEDSFGNIPNDLKLFCFNGNPQFTYVTFNPINEKGEMTHDYLINLYDIDWNYIPVQYGQHPTNGEVDFKKPENYETIIRIAKKLSEEFPFVRVDLYNVEGKIYFGELTWVPSSDDLHFTPEKYDRIFGEMLELPNKKVF